MKKLLVLIALLMASAFTANAQCTRYNGRADQPGLSAVTAGTSSSTKHVKSWGGATVHIYQPGTTTTVSLFSDSSCATPKANPMTAAADSTYFFYTSGQSAVDIRISGTGITPFTISSVFISGTGVQTTRTIAATSPLRIDGGASADLSANRTLTITDAAADGSTKGAATFTAADFNATSGNISIDYTNGQTASGAAKGFLSAADWTTFNNKEAALTFSSPLSRSVNTISCPTCLTGNETITLSGDVTGSGATAITTAIANDAVTYAKMQNISTTDRLLGRDTAGAGNTEELTVGGGVEFTGSGGIQRSALTGDVTASAGSSTTTIANDAVTYAKMQNVSAASKLLGRGDSGSGDVQEITLGTGLTMTGTTLSTSGLSATGTLNVIPRVTNATGPVYGDSAVSDDSTSVSSTRQFQILTTTTNFMRWTRDSSGNSKWLQTLLRPAAPTAALVVDASGNCTAGDHSFKVTYVTAAGETDASASPSNTVACDATHTKVTITIPTNNTATGYNTIATGRNIYATKVGDASTWYRIAASPVVANNLDTTYTFNIADASFTATTAPTANTAIDARISIDNLGNVNIGGTNPQFTDDGQGKSFVVESGTGAAGYIGAGTSNMADVNSVVGMIAFYNLAMGGVDHRVGHIRGTNDGALGQGALYFATSPNNVGSIDRMKIAYDGNVSIGSVAVAGGTLAVVALPAVTATGLFSGWYNNVGPTFLGGWYNNGNFHIGTETVPTANATHLLVFGPNGATDPTMGANTAAIYAKDVAGTVEMFAIDTGGGVTQLTIPYGTGVQTALGVNVGSAGAFVVNGGALGSPSSAGTMPAFTLGGTVSGGLQSVTNLGTTLIGHTAALGRVAQAFEVTTSANFGGAALNTFSATAGQGAIFDFNRSRSATKGTQTVLASGDRLGSINFRGSDGVDFENAAAIISEVDTTPGANDMPGNLQFWTTPDGTNTAVKRFAISNAGGISINGTITAGGTTGAQTINKPSGSVNFAAGASTLVVTNSLATTSSVIVATAAANDATCSVKDVEAAAGSFTIRMTAACTGETRVNWIVMGVN